MLFIIVLLSLLCSAESTVSNDCDSNCVVQQGSGSGN